MMDETKPTGIEKGTLERDAPDAQDRCFWGRAGGKAGGVDLANRTIDGVASSINVDRDGEIILPRAIAARLAVFTASSRPFLSAHTHRTYTGAPGQIGWVAEIEVRDIDVRCKFRFVDDADSAAERWWKLASDPNGNGIMFSVGFIPVRWVYGSVADLAEEFPEIRPAVVAAGLSGEDRLRVWTEIELLEVSAVPVPANREAIQLLAAKALAAGEEADKVLAEFKADLAAEVARQLGEGAPAADKWCKALEAKLKEATAELKRFIAEGLAEIQALLPDTINPAAPAEHAPPPAEGTPPRKNAAGTRPGDDAAQPRGGKSARHGGTPEAAGAGGVEDAAKALLATCGS